MSAVINDRFTTEVDHPFVVFLIGARVNQFWAFRKWMWVSRQMPPMLNELYTHAEEKGFLGAESFFRFSPLTSIMVSYWRSFEDLERFARSKDDPHLKSWQEFYKVVGMDGSVGIWHETYMIDPGKYEVLYANMPLFGLAKATGKVVNTRDYRAKARGRVTGKDAELAPELEVTL